MKVGLRIVAGLVSVAFVLYGGLLLAEARTIVGVNSKLHGAGIIVLGAIMGRYAILGRTGLRQYDKRL